VFQGKSISCLQHEESHSCSIMTVLLMLQRKRVLLLLIMAVRVGLKGWVVQAGVGGGNQSQ
jgi:hypothetical protein